MSKNHNTKVKLKPFAAEESVYYFEAEKGRQQECHCWICEIIVSSFKLRKNKEDKEPKA